MSRMVIRLAALLLCLGSTPTWAVVPEGLPLRFEPNVGQADGQVRFLARGEDYTVFLTPGETVITLVPPRGSSKPAKAAVVRVALVGSRTDRPMTGVEPVAGTTNYLVGRDPSRWHRGIPGYAQVRYEAVYPGVDLLFYGNQRHLEHDFVLAPGADPSAIRLAITGGDVALDADGALEIRSPGGAVRFRRPDIYQERDGRRTPVSGGYTVVGDGQVAFRVGPYDRARPLVIDPVLVYSTYAGIMGNENVKEGPIAIDPLGNAYIAGFTGSANFPNSAFGGGLYDAFVLKLNAAGNALVYATYIGGSGDDNASGIAVDAAGNAYVTGGTNSPDFPVTAGALQPVYAGGDDAFVVKLDPTGSHFAYASYLGGSGDDGGVSIAIDSAGSAYVVGNTTSTDFPVLNAVQSANHGGADLFIAKLAPTGSALVYSTYFGGTGSEKGLGIAVDPFGIAHAVGNTTSCDFPTTANAAQAQCAHVKAGQTDGFVLRLDPDGSLRYSTYLGGSGGSSAFAVAVDASGSTYVTGQTSAGFPTTANALFPTFQSAKASDPDAFVTKFDATGAIVYSTYLGGPLFDFGRGIAVDATGAIYVSGRTSGQFPTVNATQPSYGGGPRDGFLAKLNSAGSALVFSTYIGGSGEDHARFVALDAAGNAYVNGWTDSTDFPVVNAYRPFLAGAADMFVAKIGDRYVAIDVKPGSDTNPINPRSRGTIPVAILSTATFDAPRDVDPASLTFGRTGTEPSLRRCNASGEDVNGDGRADLVCHFETEASGFQVGDSVAILRGATRTGDRINGSDTVRIVP